jgi:tRNA(fMet)-specific endonuclease VapC
VPATRFLLDTNVAIAVLEGQIDLGDRFADGLEIFTNATVLGELYFGAEKSGRVQPNRERVESLIAKFPPLPCDAETASHFGRIRQELRASGRQIPYHDVWIAATARQHRLVLATRDGHFAEVQGLAIDAW